MRVQGYATISEPGGGVAKCDTFTCNHCNSIVFVPVHRRVDDMGGHCRLCDRDICSKCVDLNQCVPFERSISEYEAKMEARRSYGV